MNDPEKKVVYKEAFKEAGHTPNGIPEANFGSSIHNNELNNPGQESISSQQLPPPI